MKYWAFVSYTSTDEKAAIKLHQFLESYLIPKPLVGKLGKLGEPIPPRLYPVFRDRDELGAASSLPDELKARLSVSRWLVVVCSRKTPSSRWVNEEVQHFISARGREYVICVFPDGADSASMPMQLPDALAKTEELPLGVDLSGKESVTIARLRLVATLAGLEFTSLQDRDANRKRRQLTITAALVITGGTVLVLFVLSQFSAREHAVYASALANAGLPASSEDVMSLKDDVQKATSPIVSWRGRRFITSGGILKHATALDGADYVFDPTTNTLLVLSKDGGDEVSMLDFPSLDTVIGQVAAAENYGLDYEGPAVRLGPRRYALHARIQSSSAGGAIPVLVTLDGTEYKVRVFGLDGLNGNMFASADCSSFAVGNVGELKVFPVGQSRASVTQTAWIEWTALSDTKLHTCGNLIPIVRREP